MKGPSQRSPITRYFKVGLLILLLQGLSEGLAGQSPFPLPGGEHQAWVVLFVYPPSLHLREDSPRAMLQSTVRIELRRIFSLKKRVLFQEEDGAMGVLSTPYFSTIGHTIAWLYCPDSNGAMQGIWASLSAHDFAGRGLKRILQDGRAMGVLFDAYPDAYLLGNVENPLRLLHYRGWRQNRHVSPRYLAFPVEDCSQALRLVRVFREAARPALFPSAGEETTEGLVFASYLDPYATFLRWEEEGRGPLGGGCAPFGIAMLKSTNAYHPAMDSLWDMIIEVPEDLIGEEGRKVSVLNLLAGRRSSTWSRSIGKTRRYVNPDPQRIWEWIGNETDHGSLPGRKVMVGPMLEIKDPLPQQDQRRSVQGTSIQVSGVIITNGGND